MAQHRERSIPPRTVDIDIGRAVERIECQQVFAARVAQAESRTRSSISSDTMPASRPSHSQCCRRCRWSHVEFLLLLAMRVECSLPSRSCRLAPLWSACAEIVLIDAATSISSADKAGAAPSNRRTGLIGRAYRSRTSKAWFVRQAWRMLLRLFRFNRRCRRGARRRGPACDGLRQRLEHAARANIGGGDQGQRGGVGRLRAVHRRGEQTVGLAQPRSGRARCAPSARSRNSAGGCAARGSLRMRASRVAIEAVVHRARACARRWRAVPCAVIGERDVMRDARAKTRITLEERSMRVSYPARITTRSSRWFSMVCSRISIASCP
jgi:hypothetical protein